MGAAKSRFIDTAMQNKKMKIGVAFIWTPVLYYLSRR
jgi:hypothetical protein